jgi:hypothetical protein
MSGAVEYFILQSGKPYFHCIGYPVHFKAEARLNNTQ